MSKRKQRWAVGMLAEWFGEDFYVRIAHGVVVIEARSREEAIGIGLSQAQERHPDAKYSIAVAPIDGTAGHVAPATPAEGGAGA